MTQRTRRLLDYLERQFGGRAIELSYSNHLELLIATILSAQCTDDRVNRVTPVLFKKYRKARDFARANPGDLEKIIHSTGFFRSKAKNIIRCCQMLVERHGGKVPDHMEALIELPGVWRKTANVVLGACFGRPTIVVDTHVKRVSGRLELTRSANPDRIEEDLSKILPRDRWSIASHQLLLHGRHICKARKPLCSQCGIFPICRWEGKS